MKQVVVERFGGPEVLELRDFPTRYPAPGQVLVRLLSIGVNRADVMARRGQYLLASGPNPFTPGLEAGGIIEAVGEDVPSDRIGQRVVLSPDAPRPKRGLGGTYRSHYLCHAEDALPVPAVLPDECLGALWLTHLTAWGCLVWKHGLRKGQTVAIPAASSAVGLAAAQVVRQQGGVCIGMTSSPDKRDAIRDAFDHLVLTHDSDGQLLPFHRELHDLTDGKGVDVFFDPVASGAYLDQEIRSLADHGTVYVYGLLGDAGVVDLTPLIRKRAKLVGWVNGELLDAGHDAWLGGCRFILQQFARGYYHQRIADRFPLERVQDAHRLMESNRYVGKIILQP
jgi:NADPH:quinone reductase-like Zn-dependent oxidoreductase